MRILTAALVMFSFQSASFGQNPSTTAGPRTDRDYANLIGPVRVVRTEIERKSNSGGNKGQVIRELREIVIYDDAGRLKQTLTFGGGNCAMSRRVIEYENAASRSERVFFGKAVVDRDGSSQGTAWQTTFKQTLKFDGGGNRTQIDDYDPEGRLHLRTVYKVDGKGRVIEEAKGRDDAESIFIRCTFKYDLNGLVTEEECKRSSGPTHQNEISKFKYETDAKGNWIKRTGESSWTVFDGSTRKGDVDIAHRVIEYYDATTVGRSQPSAAQDSQIGVELKPCESMVVRKSGGALQGSATKRKSPSYPLLALEKRIEGSVVVEVTTDEDGKVVSVRSISGPAELRSAAEQAAMAWEFKPTYLSGVPVRIVGTITFNFTL